MKRPRLLPLLTLALATGTASAAETDASRPELVVPVRPSQQTAAVRATPIRNHWDANSWDPIGGSLFWHDRSEKRRQEVSEKSPQPPKGGPASTDRKPSASPQR